MLPGFSCNACFWPRPNSVLHQHMPGFSGTPSSCNSRACCVERANGHLFPPVSVHGFQRQSAQGNCTAHSQHVKLKQCRFSVYWRSDCLHSGMRGCLCNAMSVGCTLEWTGMSGCDCHACFIAAASSRCGGHPFWLHSRTWKCLRTRSL